MATFKCKMCGGDLNITEGMTVAQCEYCGTTQTLPRLDDDQRANLYDRANHFRRNNDYDKAMGIYDQILNEDRSDAEAYWSLVLCRYGIEYVEDPATHKRVPTVNRAQYTSIFADEDYKAALQYADIAQREVYEAEAKAIDEIQKGILSISQQEEPFDVFICYKETDANGRRTPDSVLANDLYHQLTQEGFKVFFARITLEDKLGQEYEPYIFAALNSAKVMVVLGTKPEYFNAVWVKNEWSRYLALIRSGAKKVLVPAYKDMDPYDLPEEFSHLQAQDMGKLGFMQDLIRGIKKLTAEDTPKATVKETVVMSGSGGNADALLKRGMMALEDSEWQKADGFFEEVLNLNAECAEAYLGKLMAELQVTTPSSLANCPKPFDGLKNYQKAVRFGDKGLATELQGYIDHINKRNENLRLSSIYRKAKGAMEKAQSEADFLDAAKQFDTISSFQDAAVLSQQCREKAEEARKDKIYDNACKLMRDEDFRQMERAIVAFESIPGWRDADEKIQKCTAKIEKRKAAIRAAEQRKKRVLSIVGKVTVVVTVVGIVVYCLLTFLILPLPHYRNAEELLSQGDIANAAIEYGNAGIYLGAKAKSLALWEQMDTSSIAAGLYHTVALKNDGSVIAIGRNDNNQCDVAQWKNVVSISAGSSHTVALLKDGTVVATGSNTAGQCNVEDWTDIIAVSAGNSHTVGLKSDGTVVAVGKNSAGQCDVDDWTDIVAISANGSHTVGLKSDGSVVAVGSNSSGQCDVDDWTDIVAISAGASYTVGLKSDGTVVAVGNDSSGQCDVDDWTDIVAISAGSSHTVGLKSDGTIVAIGGNGSGQCDVDDWEDVVAISAGGGHTVGLKSDGTVVAVGNNGKGQCDDEDWTDIRVPG